MAESLFEEKNEDELSLRGTFEDIFIKGWQFTDLHQFVGDKIVWISGDCSIVRHSPPPDHSFSLSFTHIGGKKENKTLEVTASSSNDATSAINGLLYLCSHSADDEVEVTLKCFATNPRTSLSTLIPLTDSHLACLRLHFLALDQPTCEALIESNVRHLELRQSTMDGFERAVLESTNGGPNQLTISCTMPEFSKLAGSLRNNATITILTLQLHFFVQGEVLNSFVSSLKTNKGLRELSIDYLDISDDGWSDLCQALEAHPAIEKLKLKFTDSFVDDFRRLDVDRRAARTNDVLKLVQTNKNIKEVAWPDYQKDEATMLEVTKCLSGNSNTSQYNSF